MHVSHSVDSDRFADHAVREDERKAAYDVTANGEIGPNTGKRRTDAGETSDQLRRSLDGSVEPNATARTLLLVPIGGCIKLGACGRRELDRLHVGF